VKKRLQNKENKSPTASPQKSYAEIETQKRLSAKKEQPFKNKNFLGNTLSFENKNIHRKKKEQKIKRQSFSTKKELKHAKQRNDRLNNQLSKVFSQDKDAKLTTENESPTSLRINMHQSEGRNYQLMSPTDLKSIFESL